MYLRTWEISSWIFSYPSVHFWSVLVCMGDRSFHSSSKSRRSRFPRLVEYPSGTGNVGSKVSETFIGSHGAFSVSNKFLMYSFLLQWVAKMDRSLERSQVWVGWQYYHSDNRTPPPKLPWPWESISMPKHLAFVFLDGLLLHLHLKAAGPSCHDAFHKSFGKIGFQSNKQQYTEEKSHSASGHCAEKNVSVSYSSAR